VLGPTFLLSSFFIGSVNDAFAVAVELPPQAAPEEFPGKGPPDRIIIMEHGNLRAEMRLLYVTVDDHNDHNVTAGGALDGVGKVVTTIPGVNTFGCT